MKLNKFSLLNEGDKLSTIKQIGKLQTLFTLDIYQFSLYLVEDFYVEVRRNMNEPHLVSILETGYDDVSMDYKMELEMLSRTKPQLELVM